MSRHPILVTMDSLMAVALVASAGAWGLDSCIFCPEVREWARAHEAWLELPLYAPLLVGACGLVAAFWAGVDDARLELKRRESKEAKDGGQESK